MHPDRNDRNLDTRPRTRGAGLAIAAFALAGVAGCAGYSPKGLPPGASSAQAIEKLGAPTGRHAGEAGGARLEFARGPAGVHTYMLDFDAGDRLLGWEQVLNEQNFLDLKIGMSKTEVLRRIGRPSNVRFLSRQQHQLWSYRYDTPFCIWYQVSLDTADRVAELGHNVDPACERLNSRH